MSASHNRVVLIGNLTRDPELRYTQSGLAVTDIGLAVNDRRKNESGEWVEETTFVNVTVWGRQAEVAGEYLSKGSPVFFEGRLKLDTWEKDGQKQSKLKVVAEKMQLLSSNKGGGGSGGAGGGARPMGQRRGGAQNDDDGADYGAPRQASAEPAEDDIPF